MIRTAKTLAKIDQIVIFKEKFIPVFGNVGVATVTVIVASPTAFQPLAKAVTLTVFVVVCLRCVEHV